LAQILKNYHTGIDTDIRNNYSKSKTIFHLATSPAFEAGDGLWQ
jgi:hypothetical protein